MYPYTSWLLCCTGFSLWVCTGQVLEFIILVLIYVILSNLYIVLAADHPKQPNNTNSIIILLSHTYRIELYIVVLPFQKKEAIISIIGQQHPIFSSIKVVKISLLSCNIVFNPSTPHRNRTPTPFDCCVMHSWWLYMI